MIRLAPWLLLAALSATAAAYGLGRKHGADAEGARRDLQDAATLRTAVERAARAGDALRKIGARLASALEASRGAEAETVRTVVEVIRENPDFAVVARPAELDRLRREQLQAVTRAVDPDQL